MTFLISQITSVTVLGGSDHVRSPHARCPVADNDAGPAAPAGGGAGSDGPGMPIGLIFLTSAYATALMLLAPIRRLLPGGEPVPKSPTA